MSNAKLAETLKALQELSDRKKFRKIEFFKPYVKQEAFFNMGAFKRERMFRAGNQVGKSEAGCYEDAVHATGLYPDWWKGKRFREPTRGWVAGITSTAVRDIQQKKLMGQPGVTSAQGTGFIPKDCIIDTSLARGVTDAYDTVQVKHYTDGSEDGISTVTFKSFEQGREKFQGDTIHYGHGDEESKYDVYEEFLARLRGDGILYTTFTPLLGRTALVLRFEDVKNTDCGLVQMVLSEALHFTPEERAKRLAGYSRHMRDAREKGIPFLGSGRVFITDEEQLMEPRILTIPPSWTALWSIDFGIGHPFAAVLTLWDKDADCLHVHHAIRMQSEEGQLNLPLMHAAAMKPIGQNVPVAWPKDGTQRDKGSGIVLSKNYKDAGLRMLDEPAMWPDGGDSTEAGITEMETRMATGKYKVASHLVDWFEEYREYHRDDGLIVKERDDLMSASRVGVMAKRFGKAVILGAGNPNAKRKQQVADGIDFDVF